LSYANRTRQPPRTLSDAEQKLLLKVSGEHRDGFRDHVIFSLALGTALRESEILGLDVGDVSPDGLKVRRTIQLRVFKRAGTDTANPADQRVHLPDGCYWKLQKYLRSLYLHQTPSETCPLFLARTGRRLSARRLREIFHEWQAEAGFDFRYNFHALRHTAITNLHRDCKDIRLAQRFARHTNIATTTRYEHASDQEVADAVKGLRS
jgi:site-specific recombinase XerD